MKRILCLQSLYKSFFAAVLVCFTAATLISCENFLKGSNTPQQLERLVSYANAPGCTVLLKSDEAMGSFMAGDSTELKVGYETEFYYSANINNCILEDVIAQSATDSGMNMSDYISIKITERDDETGFYKINIKLLQKASNIIITPVCLAFPYVKAHSPANDSEAVFANTPIILTFNVPMEAAETSYAQTLFNYKNIFLSYNGKDVTQYFEAPVFNEEKTVLTLTPSPSFINFLQETKEIVVPVEVGLGESIAIKKGNRILALRQNENSYFTVHYKPESERIAPVKAGYGFFASKEDYELEELNNMTQPQLEELKMFSEGNLSIKGNITAEEYNQKVVQNITGGDVYIYGRYYDKDSGVNSVSVTFQYNNDREGILLRNKPHTPDIYYVNSNYSNAWFIKNGDYVLFKLKYNVSEGDGAYIFNVNVSDTCNNAAVQEDFTAFRDTVLELGELKVFNIYNDLDDNTSDESDRLKAVTNIFNAGKYNETIKTIQFLYKKQVYANVTAAGLLDFFVKYINAENEEVTEPVSVDEKDNRLHKHTLNVEHVHDLKITIIAKDAFGNEASCDFDFPPMPQIYSDSRVVYLPGDAKVTAHYNISKEDDVYVKGYASKVKYPNDTFTCPNPSYSNQDKPAYVFYENGLLFSETHAQPLAIAQSIQTVFTLDPSKTIPDGVSILSIDPDVTDDGRFYTRTIKIPDNTWALLGDEYDYLMVVTSLTSNPGIQVSDACVGLFEKGCTTKIIYSNGPETIKKYYFLVGIKGEVKSKLSSSWKTFRPEDEQIEALNKELFFKAVPKFDGVFCATQSSDNMLQETGFDKCNDMLYLPNVDALVENVEVTVNNAYRYTIGPDKIGTTKDFFVIHEDTNNENSNYVIPIMDFSFGENLVSINFSNQYGSSSFEKLMTIEKSPLTFITPEGLPSSTITLKSAPCEINTIDDEMWGSFVYIAYFDADGWHNYKERCKLTNSAHFTIKEENSLYIYSKELTEVPLNTFIKVSTNISYGDSCSNTIFYNGASSHGKASDRLINLGDEFLVASDQPVYIFTTGSMHSYDECSKWTVEDWETFHIKSNERYLDFSVVPAGTMLFYTPDTTWMPDDCCYVVIAHFADGHVEISEVKEK